MTVSHTLIWQVLEPGAVVGDTVCAMDISSGHVLAILSVVTQDIRLPSLKLFVLVIESQIVIFVQGEARHVGNHLIESAVDWVAVRDDLWIIVRHFELFNQRAQRRHVRLIVRAAGLVNHGY